MGRKAKEPVILEIFSNNKIIAQGQYQGIKYLIRKVSRWYCAYIIVNKKIKENGYLGDQQITYFSKIKDCSFVEDKKMGKYIYGWDYAHSYNYKATIDVVDSDVRHVIKEISNNGENR